jgi:hypothetical protein
VIGQNVSRAPVIDIREADGVPGLYDVLLEDGTTLNDLTTYQTQSLVERNGTVARDEV